MAANITPPGSVLEPPLTPPPTAEKGLSRSAQSVVTFLRLHRASHRPSLWWEGRLRPDDYTQVLNLLDTDEHLRSYVEDKVRYDYDPCRYCLTVRMPSPVHDTFCAMIVDEISTQLKQLQKNDELADFVQQVEPFATSRIFIPEETRDGKQKYIKREPDASFGHHRGRYPGVIVEVCYSQKSRRISHLADQYILNTDGSVNAVIALDIDYRGSKKATISVWRPEYIMVKSGGELRATAVIEAQPFRTDSGLPSGAALRLSLRDFATEELSRGHTGLHHEIVITSQQLCDFLSRAEARQQAQTQQQGSVNRIRPGYLKRPRSPTPCEGLSSEGGKYIKKREGKRGRQDSDYRPSSSSGESKDQLY